MRRTVASCGTALVAQTSSTKDPLRTILGPLERDTTLILPLKLLRMRRNASLALMKMRSMLIIMHDLTFYSFPYHNGGKVLNHAIRKSCRQSHGFRSLSSGNCSRERLVSTLVLSNKKFSTTAER